MTLQCVAQHAWDRRRSHSFVSHVDRFYADSRWQHVWYRVRRIYQYKVALPRHLLYSMCDPRDSIANNLNSLLAFCQHPSHLCVHSATYTDSIYLDEHPDTEFSVTFANKGEAVLFKLMHT